MCKEYQGSLIPLVTHNLPELRFSQRRNWASEQAIGFLIQQAVENPEVVSLAAGLVDPELLPVAETRAALDKLLADEQRAKQMLQYGTIMGAEFLREQLIDHLAHIEKRSRDDLNIDINRIVLTTGSQQLLSLVGEVLFNPGDICLVAAPTYFVFLSTLNGLGACTISVETDDGGMQPEALESKLEQLEAEGELDRVKLIYLVSYYDNPSGLSLSEERRSAIVEIVQRWSKRNQIVILEDAAYRELRYDGPTFSSVWSFDESQETVILGQTFSKSFSPGLRVGFGVVPSQLVKPICDRKGNEDFGSANFNQHLIATVLEQGLYQPHVEHILNSYRAKRDCMLDAVDKYFSGLTGVRWVHPHGGLYVWMTLPENVDTGFDGPLFNHATKVQNVMYVPGDLCYAIDPPQRPRNHLRLSFGVQTLEGIELGVQRLSNAVHSII